MRVNWDKVRNYTFIAVIASSPISYLIFSAYGKGGQYPLGITLALYSTIIALIVSLLGFLIGKILKYQNNKQ